jgi:cob(I)alamin adenosyltransferase
VQLYTGKGDDGTTGLLFGGRVAKNAPQIEATGGADEAQAFIGLARSRCERASELDRLLTGVERDLWVLMAELATAPDNRQKLKPGASLVTGDMVAALETTIDDLGERTTMPSEFVIPGQDPVAALLDVARTVVRRAERLALPVAAPDSSVVPYLNRLSTLLWVLARAQEGGDVLPARTP